MITARMKIATAAGPTKYEIAAKAIPKRSEIDVDENGSFFDTFLKFSSSNPINETRILRNSFVFMTNDARDDFDKNIRTEIIMHTTPVTIIWNGVLSKLAYGDRK
jgi:hypothetical protein